MEILNIIPGSGGSFYCGNCLRDSKYVEAIRKRGHEVIKIPMYLPLFADEDENKAVPVFYGAVSTYLKQVYPLFAKMPLWMDKWLNSSPVLKIAAKFAGSTRAKGLEEMTVSMLLGEHGKQKEELEKLADWIALNCTPDVIHISNALLLGLAARLKKKLNVPIVCSLQDEDVWVDVMKPAFREHIWKLMADKVKDVDAFIGVSQFYAEVMKTRMNIPSEKLHTIHLGVDIEGYRIKNPDVGKSNIGFISRMCYENGLDILVDAFILLKQEAGFESVKLVITGGATGDDKVYLKKIRRKIKIAGLQHYVVFHDDFEGEGRRKFFDEVALLSVPVRKGEAFGMYLLESMASGVPVVQPALGAFPEIVAKSGGGVVYEPNSPAELARTLMGLLKDDEKLKNLSGKAHANTEEYFNIYKHSDEMIEVYQKLIANLK